MPAEIDLDNFFADDADAATPPTTLPGSRKWTPQQLLGITTTGRSLLVSAAAGSGKTAMLAERCAYLVCDAPRTFRCDVDELLVVTFTDAAAAEMKARITAAVRQRVASTPSDRLNRQLALMEQAHVSTLHGFCARVLRQHFHLVGLDPGFNVLDAEEAKLLRTEVARELFADRYELDDAGDFQRFVDAYGDGDDERLVRQVIQTHELLCSVVDPAAWIGRSLKRLEEAAAKPLETTELGRELVRTIEQGLATVRARCGTVVTQLRDLGGFDKYLASLEESRQTLDYWAQVLRDDGLDALAEEAADYDPPRLPPVKSGVPNKEVAKSGVDSVREEMKKGTWRAMLRFTTQQWQDGLTGVVPHARVFLSLVEQFAKRYRDAKDETRSLDFSDLERFTLQILRDERSGERHVPTPAAHSFHRRFKHVLVDEYQDINEVQDAILALVSRECVSDGPRIDPRLSPNLFCVGDVKQSIYRFRLAEAARFLDRQRRFREEPARGAQRLGEVIDLQANFRSRAKLLAAINGVFERLMTGDAVDITYDESHHLRPGQDYPDAPETGCFPGAPIELHLMPAKMEVSASSQPEAEAPELSAQDCDPDDPDEPVDLDRTEREAALVARRVRQIMGIDGGAPTCVMEKDSSGVMSPRPIRFGDIVVLLRSMRFKADQFASALRQAGVPVHSESGTGYFESMEVRDMLSLLSLLDNQRQDIPMAAVLRSPLGGLASPEDSLARVRLAFPAKGTGAVPFHEAVVRYAGERDDELAAKLRDFLRDLADWRELAQRRPLAELLSTVFDRTGFLAFCGGLAGGEQRVANLLFLHERARQFGTFHRQGLARFLKFLEQVQAESDLGQPSIASKADDVVRVMSIHRSKGLEFPVVILADLGKGINFDDCKGHILADRSAGLGMAVVDEARRARYPSLAQVLVRNRLRQQALAEEMRVLYVAMTRAKEHLILVGTCSAGQMEKWESRWARHTGAFPPDAVLAANRLIDWLGPVAAATPPPNEIFAVTVHEPAEILKWDLSPGARAPANPQLGRLAELKPLAPPPAPNPVATELIERLRWSYPHQSFAELRAAESVTEREDGARAMKAASPSGAPPADSAALHKPRFLLGTSAPAATDVGDAAHRVLEHLDFTRPCDEADVTAQLREMVDSKRLAPAHAAAVDVSAIAWLCASEVGRLLRGHAGSLRRELPVYFPAADASSPAADPLDRVMVRGRLDVLIPRDADCVIVDYKTDAVSADTISDRAQWYAPQLRQYRDAVRRITGKAVARAYLVFLAARTSVEI